MAQRLPQATARLRPRLYLPQPARRQRSQDLLPLLSPTPGNKHDSCAALYPILYPDPSVMFFWRHNVLLLYPGSPDVLLCTIATLAATASVLRSHYSFIPVLVCTSQIDKHIHAFSCTSPFRRLDWVVVNHVERGRRNRVPKSKPLASCERRPPFKLATTLPTIMLETDTRKRPSQDPIAPPPTKKRALTGENGSPVLVNGNTPATPSPDGDEPREQDDLEVFACILYTRRPLG